jgi:hypothetical protein
MGTIITTLIAEQIKPDFIIGDGFVTSPQKVKEAIASKKIISLPQGADKYEATLAQLKIPILIFSGKKDMVTTDVEVQKLKNANSSIKVIIFDGGHMEGFQMLSKTSYGSEYIGAIERFIF